MPRIGAVPEIRWPESFNEMCSSVQKAFQLDFSLDLADISCWVTTNRCAPALWLRGSSWG